MNFPSISRALTIMKRKGAFAPYDQFQRKRYAFTIEAGVTTGYGDLDRKLTVHAV